jgi:hypothetical protein
VIRWTHYREIAVGHGWRHTLAFKAFGRYLILTWHWS